MRIRIRFTKQGKIRFISHRDLARVWERTIRRVDLPVAYSQGFSPRPKVHFGLALPTGAESLCEYLDVDLRDVDLRDDALKHDALHDALSEAELDAPGLIARLNPVLPVGIEATALAEISTGTTSLQEAVTSSIWRIVVAGTEVHEAVERLLAADELITTRQRKGHPVTDDIRPYILDLAVEGPTQEGTELVAELGTRPRGLRPSELIVALGDQFREVRICRTHQWMQHDGARQEPLPLSAPSAPRALERAS